VFVLKYSPNRYLGEWHDEDANPHEDGNPYETPDFWEAKRFDDLSKALKWAASDPVNINPDQVYVMEFEISIRRLSEKEVDEKLATTAKSKLTKAERKALGLK